MCNTSQQHFYTILSHTVFLQRNCKPREPVGSVTSCALVNTIILQPYDGPGGSKHVAQLLVP